MSPPIVSQRRRSSLRILESTQFKKRQLDELIKELRSRLKETSIPGSIIPRTDTAFLGRFLRVKDLDLDKALKAILKYYNCIHKNRKLHQGTRPSQTPAVFHSPAYSILKHRFNGAGLLFAKLKFWYPTEIKLVEFQRGFIFVAEQFLNQVELQENGISVIIDLDGLRMEHIWHASIKEIRRCADIAFKGLPIRLKSIHVLNAPSIFWPVYHVGKRFVKDKIHQRVHFHSNVEELHEFFERKYLPQSLGGELSDAEAEETTLRLEVLEKDVPFEEYWNGETFQQKFERRLLRKRSSMSMSIDA